MRFGVQPWLHSMPTPRGITPTRRTHRSAQTLRTLLLKMSCLMPSNLGAMTTQTSGRWQLLASSGTSTDQGLEIRNTAVKSPTDCGLWAGRDPTQELVGFCLMDPKPTKPSDGSDLMPHHCPNHCPMLKTLSLTTYSLLMGQWGSTYRRVIEGGFW